MINAFSSEQKFSHEDEFEWSTHSEQPIHMKLMANSCDRWNSCYCSIVELRFSHSRKTVTKSKVKYGAY